MQADDFGSEVIPGAKDMGMHIQAYLYDGYWEDIGTVEAFYEANLALTDEPVPKFRSASLLSNSQLHGRHVSPAWEIWYAPVLQGQKKLHAKRTSMLHAVPSNPKAYPGIFALE